MVPLDLGTPPPMSCIAAVLNLRFKPKRRGICKNRGWASIEHKEEMITIL